MRHSMTAHSRTGSVNGFVTLPRATSTVDDMLDPILRLSIDIYLAVGNASQETYNSVCNALMHYNPAEPLLSYDIVKQHITRC